MQVTYGLLGPLFHGRGWQDTDTPANPAAGANYSGPVDARWWERLIAIRFQLVTDSNAANRLVTIDYTKPGFGIYHQDGPTVIQTASGTGIYNGVANFGPSDWNTGTSVFFNLWNAWLPSGFTVGITIANIQTGDQLSAIALTFERVQTGDSGYPVGAMDVADMRYWHKEFGDW